MIKCQKEWLSLRFLRIEHAPLLISHSASLYLVFPSALNTRVPFFRKFLETIKKGQLQWVFTLSFDRHVTCISKEIILLTIILRFSIITIVCNFSKSIRCDVSPHFNYPAGLFNMFQTDFKHLIEFLKYISNIPPK